MHQHADFKRRNAADVFEQCLHPQGAADHAALSVELDFPRRCAQQGLVHQAQQGFQRQRLGHVFGAAVGAAVAEIRAGASCDHDVALARQVEIQELPEGILAKRRCVQKDQIELLFCNPRQGGLQSRDRSELTVRRTGCCGGQLQQARLPVDQQNMTRTGSHDPLLSWSWEGLREFKYPIRA